MTGTPARNGPSAWEALQRPFLVHTSPLPFQKVISGTVIRFAVVEFFVSGITCLLSPYSLYALLLRSVRVVVPVGSSSL